MTARALIPKPLQFLMWSIGCQLLGFGAALLVGEVTGTYALQVLTHGAAALGAAIFVGMSTPWQILNALLPLTLPLLAGVTLPAWLLAALAAILVIIYSPTFWTRVPFYPSSPRMYELVLAELPTDRPFTFIDLGCGFGTMLSWLARRRPLGHFVGVEIGPLPWLLARLRALLLPARNLEVQLCSIWNLDLGGYEYVYAFLSPEPMPMLWEKCRREMKEGSTLLVNSFPVPAEHKRAACAHDRRDTVLFVYAMSAGR